MSKTKWIAAILIALIVVLFTIYVFKDYKPETEAPIDSKPIPEDVVVDGKPSIAQKTMFISSEGTNPRNLLITGGQALTLRVQSSDSGSYTLIIPVFNVSVTAKPGEQGEVTFKPHLYGQFRFFVQGAGENDGGFLIIEEQ